MKMFNALLKCANCGELLNIARCVPESAKETIQETAIFAGKNCPTGCKTLSIDPTKNINVRLKWVEIDPRSVNPGLKVW